MCESWRPLQGPLLDLHVLSAQDATTLKVPWNRANMHFWRQRDPRKRVLPPKEVGRQGEKSGVGKALWEYRRSPGSQEIFPEVPLTQGKPDWPLPRGIGPAEYPVLRRSVWSRCPNGIHGPKKLRPVRNIWRFRPPTVWMSENLDQAKSKWLRTAHRYGHNQETKKDHQGRKIANFGGNGIKRIYIGLCNGWMWIYGKHLESWPKSRHETF